jgi:peroxiredoxin
MKKYFLFILALFLANICFGQLEDDSSFLRINFKAESTIKVHFKNFNDTILFSTRFGNIFPIDYIEGPQKQLYGDETEYVTLKIQIPQKVDLNFSDYVSDCGEESKEENDLGIDLNVACFLVPFDTLTIEVDYAQGNQANQSITYDGKYAQVSRYYQDKATYFQGIDFIYQKGMLANTVTDLDLFKNAIDSITNIELNFLSVYGSKNKLPEWFIEYESSDINYFGYGIKISEPALMKYLYGSTAQVPEDYYSFTKDLPLENEKAILSIYYFLCPLDYFNTIWAREKIKELPAGTWNSNRSKYFVEFSTSQFSPYISDVLLARELDMLIDINRVADEEYTIITKAIKNTSLKNYLESRYEHKEILKQGDEAPYFYLKNEKDEYLSLNSFKDSVIYISFWMTGCKPCIKEFPEENRLVDIFKDEKVKIISICMDSKEENWRYMIQKYHLKTVNLYATGNWEKMLKENYDISGFPHYVIIDKNNRIIENKCVRPSQGAEQVIRKVLNN